MFFVLFLVVYDNCMYIFGGYNGEREMHFKDIYKFDPGE